MTLEQILFLIGLAFLLLGGIFIFIFNRTKNEVFGWITNNIVRWKEIVLPEESNLEIMQL